MNPKLNYIILYLQKDVILEPNIREYLPGQSVLQLTYGFSLKSRLPKNFVIAVFAATKLDVSDVSPKLILVHVYIVPIFILTGARYIYKCYSKRMLTWKNLEKGH